MTSFEACGIEAFVSEATPQANTLQEAASTQEILIQQIEGYIQRLTTALCADLRTLEGLDIDTFLGLTDTPAAYVANQAVVVNPGATALIFSPLIDTFLQLTDTPGAYGGSALDLVRVNAGATALEFIAPAADTTLQEAYDVAPAVPQITPANANPLTIDRASGAGSVFVVRNAANADVMNVSTTGVDFDVQGVWNLDGLGITFGLSSDIKLEWAAAGHMLFEFVVGEEFRLSSGAGFNLMQAGIGDAELRLNYGRFVLGETTAAGDDTGHTRFAIQARETITPIDWADVFLNQEGNLTLEDAMDTISALRIQEITLTIDGGSIVENIATVRIEGMTTANLGGAGTAGLDLTGRRVMRGVDNFLPLNDTLVGDENDYAPSVGNAMRQVWRLTASGADRTITGIDRQQENDTQWIINVANTNNIILAHQGVASLAENRIAVTSLANLSIGPREHAILWYDSTNNRWRVLSTNGT